MATLRTSSAELDPERRARGIQLAGHFDGLLQAGKISLAGPIGILMLLG